MRRRDAGPSDVEAVAELEEVLFGVDAWSSGTVAEELTGPDRVALVAQDDSGAVVGYVVVRRAGDVEDLQRLGVHPDHRRRGVARALLAGARERAVTSRLLLEVAADNDAALAFYAVEGFERIDRRRRYYRAGQDAVVMAAPVPTRRLPADEHVHTEFSWDTGPRASMWEACESALRLGLPAVSFTEHVDFTAWSAGDHPIVEGQRPRAPGWYVPVDVPAYLDAVDRCRSAFPGLVIRTGIETGEPHLFAGSVAAVLTEGGFERVLGSLHSLVRGGELIGVSQVLQAEDADAVVREYFTELVRMVEGSAVFEVLAHCDFPRRYWPRWSGPYDEADFEEEYRAVFTGLAATDRALELNTTSPLASARLLSWWRDCGGRAVSIGSDAHVPWLVGQRFAEASDVVTAAGFRVGADAGDLHRC